MLFSLSVKIAYVHHGRFPTEKAHGNQVAQVCDALGSLRHRVTILAPTVRNAITKEAHEYYGLIRSFEVVYPGSFDALSSRFIPGKLAFVVGMWSYRRALRKYFARHRFDLLYARSPAVLPPLLRTGIPVILELHTLPRCSRRFVRMCNRCSTIVCLTSLQKKELIAGGVEPHRILVEADGVDLKRFSKMPSASVARKEWKIPAGVPVAGYAGSLVTQNTIEKGVAEFVSALAEIKKDGRKIFGLIAGGPDTWKHDYQVHAKVNGLTDDDIRFTGRVAPADVPEIISAFDVCVYPAPASQLPYFLRDTSPLKLFEYLASGRPVACADLPPIRDVVDASVVRFCKPGDPHSLALAIQWLLDHPVEAEKMAEKGKAIAKEHSWEKRMGRILQDVSGTVSS